MSQAVLVEPTSLVETSPFGPNDAHFESNRDDRLDHLAGLRVSSSSGLRSLELFRPEFNELRDRGAIVMKLGGSFMESPNFTDPKQRALWERIAVEALFTQETTGAPVFIVHGGSKAIEASLNELGIPRQDKVEGLRPTCARTAEVVEQVLSHTINPALVEIINEVAGYEAASGVKGSSIFHATKCAPIRGIDIGFVGNIHSVDVDTLLEMAYDQNGRGRIVVISPTAASAVPGSKATDTVLNCNADSAAVMLGRFLHDRLGVQSFLFASDVPGLLLSHDLPDSLVSTAGRDEVLRMKAEGAISGGMIPKVEAALMLVDHGIPNVRFVNGRQPDHMALGLLPAAQIGTKFV